jgi:hypothetical protein
VNGIDVHELEARLVALVDRLLPGTEASLAAGVGSGSR